MKKLAILIISVYQNYFSLLLRTLLGTKDICRFSPSCSEYAKISIGKYGIVKGTRLAVTQLLKCQPFYKPSTI